ncbi:MAG TPA: M14 family zinc carboxypeptidase, partial [Gemmatimonadales bacterium]|nr:M14 family zinc carboxypeptidase [Gemmatimonadales bacterium]
QRIDEEYTRKIKEYLQDPRISTELVDHLPASSTVPTPLKFLGRVVGTPGELTYAKDIHRYFAAIDQSSPRATLWTIGTTEEGRDLVLLAVADEATIRDLDRYQAMLRQLTDPRTTSEEQARRLIRTAKPIYWITSGMHSPENGGPEMLMELAYRLAVSESPFIRSVRSNVITFITPVLEVDGREKQVDTYYFNKKRAPGEARLPLMYWGKYVAHDNNRDGMGQLLQLTRAVTRTFLEWKPTVLHDLHEASTYLYASTGTGPYNEQLDAITVNEWWMLAENDVMEMTKRGVPGVWTYGFYDGWVPNYMFFIAHSHNSVGRFYEVMGYGPENRVVQAGATTTSREWFRPNPPLPSINWGPRNNTNIQQSAILFALSHVGKNRELYLENYWLKNKRSVEKGKSGPTFAWVIPAGQRRKADAADAVNELRRQGLEIGRAAAPFKAGSVPVAAGDYLIRADQPYRTLADMYFSVQNYAVTNPSPYDDTGWTFQFMRNLVITPVTDKSVLDQRVNPITAEVTAPGGLSGSGTVVVVDHTSDNNLMTFRFRLADVKMYAAEDDFEAGGQHFQAGAFLIPNADRARVEPLLSSLGLSGRALDALPTVPTHELDIPRIGYLHAWQRTQDEGWVRAALERYGVPFSYFADQKLREGNLRAKYDVIVYPHVGGNAQSQVNGIPMTGKTPLPYRKSAETPNLGANDASDDIRGGMGLPGLMELYQFVEEGGTLIVEGSTATIFPEYNLTAGITVENPSGLFARGSIMRGVVADRKSPLAYGYAAQVPVYFSQSPVLNAGGPGGGLAGFGGGGGAPNAGLGQTITPMANRLRLSVWDSTTVDPYAPPRRPAGAAPSGGGGGGGGGGGFGGLAALTQAGERPRVVLQFPSNPEDMLLSGTLAGGQALAGRAQVVDATVGKGHVVMFAIRPFWRWQTQGTFMLGFNAILNWNDLGAGRPARGTAPVGGER